MSLIEVENLNLQYGNNQVIAGANFKIDAGDYVFIIGGNGSGKSTLVKSILGILKPASGDIKVDGKLFDTGAVARKFGYVPQFTKIEREFPISVREVIKLECELSKQACTADVLAHLREFDAEKLVDKKLSDLSGGEFQKVMIARAMVTHPQVLILDEPTNNLDDKTSEKLRQMLMDLNQKQGITVIVITHDHAELHTADHKQRVLLVHEGKVEEKDADKFFHKHL